MNDELLKLQNQLCFPLYAASRGVVNKYKPFLDEIDLTYTQYIVMMVMWERKKVSVKDLGQCLYLDSGTLTPVLKRLEAKRLITRKRSQEDERQVDILITEDGELLKERAVLIPEKMSKCISLDMEEAKTLYKLLYKLINQVE